MTNPPAFTLEAQTISLGVVGQPDVENRFGPGHIRPDGVRLTYRGPHIDARVDGWWVRENGELTDSRLDQHYARRDAVDIVQWPDWLCALATLLRPATVSLPAPAPTDRTALRDRLDAAIDDVFTRWQTGLGGQRPQDAIRDAVLVELPAGDDRAAILREAADVAESLRQFEPATGARWSAQVSENVGILRVAGELRRRAAASSPGCMADEAQSENADALRCICGDPVQLMDDSDPTSWIHSPGSDTRCLYARPRCHYCGMPHDLDPASGVPAACASIRASLGAVSDEREPMAYPRGMVGAAEIVEKPELHVPCLHFPVPAAPWPSGRVECGTSVQTWWCHLPPGHHGGCIPRRDTRKTDA
ncbi:hypothetical protein AB0F46_18730 [Streptomyces sp. NPDC026665]|uniref:hypothetical protein n=1 Tax=Streptomyces sp. NPDC026665 TaxID=3154798 RepID=UPI003405DDE1